MYKPLITRLMLMMLTSAMILHGSGRHSFASGETFPGGSVLSGDQAHMTAEETVEIHTRSLVGLAKRYENSVAGTDKQGLLDEMVALAQKRRQHLALLTADNPGAVLRMAVPKETRSRLPLGVQEYIETEQVIEGTLKALYEDYEHDYILRHFVKTGDKHISVHFKSEPPALKAGKKVRLKGILFESASTGVSMEADGSMVVGSGEQDIQYLAPGDETASSTASAPALDHTLGEQQTLVLLVNFQDTADQQPFTVAQAHDAVFGTVSDYFYEASSGQTWLAGEAHGWYTLPIDSTCSSFDIIPAANAAAAADGVDPAAYERIVYVLKGNAGCFWAGAAGVGGYPSWALINGSLNPKVIAHEIGHNFGLQHSLLLECGDSVLGSDCTTPKGDMFDTMGAAEGPGHFNAFQKERLGWFLPGEILTVTYGGTHDLQPFELPGGAQPKAIKILKEVDPAGQGSTWYYLEYRQALGFDSFIAGNDNVENGIMVHTGADFDANSSRMLDMTPNSSIFSSYDYLDPALTIGQSFTDPASGLTISTVGADASGSTVSISLEEAGCVRGNPAITFSPPEGPWVPAGTAVNYDVTVTSTDSDACFEAAFDLEAAVPAGWSAAFDSDTMMLGPGASASARLTVTSASSVADGFYGLSATATNRMEQAYQGSADATYVISTVSSVNDPPVAMDDAATTAVNTAAIINVLANDVDPNGDALTVSAISSGANGSVRINADATVTYTPKKRFNGTDTFTYTVTDGTDSIIATVTVSVTKGSEKGGGGGKGNRKKR